MEPSNIAIALDRGRIRVSWNFDGRHFWYFVEDINSDPLPLWEASKLSVWSRPVDALGNPEKLKPQKLYGLPSQRRMVSMVVAKLRTDDILQELARKVAAEHQAFTAHAPDLAAGAHARQTRSSEAWERLRTRPRTEPVSSPVRWPLDGSGWDLADGQPGEFRVCFVASESRLQRAERCLGKEEADALFYEVMKRADVHSVEVREGVKVVRSPVVWLDEWTQGAWLTKKTTKGAGIYFKGR